MKFFFWEGMGGGLALLWYKGGGVDLQSFYKNHIDVIVDDILRNGKWRLTSSNGNPKASHSLESWDLLKRLDMALPLPWVVLGI